jgi:acetyl-CoA acetyltransferase family protein
LSDSVVIVAGRRTPFVRAGEDLRDVPVDVLATSCSRELIDVTGVKSSEISELILGCCAQPPDRANPARVVSLRAGMPVDRPAHTVARNCASGMQAIVSGELRVARDENAVILAGGAESMSRIPLLFPVGFGFKLASLSKARTLGEKLSGWLKFRWSDLKPRIGLLEGLKDPFSGEMMGDTAERLAREWNISREAQDQFSMESHRRALAAKSAIHDEISPFAIPPHLDHYLTDDIGPREKMDPAKIARMKPYFDRRMGTVTVANSCGITDGAAMVLLMRESRAKALGLKPLARIVNSSFVGCDPLRMGLGPVHALAKVLEQTGLKVSDLECVELNEAFAAQVLACQEALSSPQFSRSVGFRETPGAIAEDRLNPEGGAIALGHPVGASGARIVLSLARKLNAAGGGHGVATMCIGGGQGGAILLEGMAS